MSLFTWLVGIYIAGWIATSAVSIVRVDKTCKYPDEYAFECSWCLLQAFAWPLWVPFWLLEKIR